MILNTFVFIELIKKNYVCTFWIFHVHGICEDLLLIKSVFYKTVQIFYIWKLIFIYHSYGI